MSATNEATEASSLPPERLATLARALDEIVPPSADGRFPGAGEVGLAEGLSQRADLRPVLEAGLAELDAIARAAGAAGFLELPPGEHRRALEGSAERAPAFLPTLVARTFIAYYQHPRVMEALGLGSGPPFPSGYPVAATDFSILAPVRERRPIYREPQARRTGGSG